MVHWSVRNWQLSTLMLALLILTACSPQASPRVVTAEKAERGTAGAPKRLVVGILDEPTSFAPWSGSVSRGGAQQPGWLMTRTLTLIDNRGLPQPDLALHVPSVENGDWQIRDDGTMEQTWTLRPGATWHDGEPLSASDFVFAWDLQTDPGVPPYRSAARGLIDSVQAADPETIVITFNATTPLAGAAMLTPYPRHLLADRLAADPGQIENLDYWTTGYIGAGPYRLADWQLGSSLTVHAFAPYVGGAPRIDDVTFRFLHDVNALLANILAGEVDVALPEGLSLEMAADLQRGWAAPGTGNQVVLYPDGRLYRIEFQYRPDYARPLSALDPQVRRAFYQTVDKQGLVQIAVAGLGQIADSWIPPSDPRRATSFRDAIPSWSYDPGAAEQILGEDGWRRGADGVLSQATTGERLDTEIRIVASKDNEKLLAVLADGWRRAGAAVTETVIPAAISVDNEYRATFPFAAQTGQNYTLQWEDDYLSCVQVARAETRWVGNRSGYCSPTAQPLLDRLRVTIPDDERTRLQESIMRITLRDDYVYLPLYWQAESIVARAGVTGPGPSEPSAYPTTTQGPWNIDRWDKG